MPSVTSEILDKLYVCKECKTHYLFRSDVAEHQQMTGHNIGFTEILVDSIAK